MARLGAVAAGADGLIVEVHPNPAKAKSDGAQSLKPEKFAKMVQDVKEMTQDWEFDVISMGYPGPVKKNVIKRDPHNLAPGWIKFDFGKAFEKPVKVVNDAAMQAIGSYEGGRMLFLGLGTGLGSVLIVEGVVAPLELAHLPYKKGLTFEEYVGNAAMEQLGKKQWRKEVVRVIEILNMAMEPDYVVLGGGNAKKLKEMPTYCRLGSNLHAFQGGFRMWTDSAIRF